MLVNGQPTFEPPPAGPAVADASQCGGDHSTGDHLIPRVIPAPKVSGVRLTPLFNGKLSKCTVKEVVHKQNRAKRTIAEVLQRFGRIASFVD